jgi:hypothetical protein
VIGGKTVREYEPARDAKGEVMMSPAYTTVWDVHLVDIDFDPKFTEDEFKVSQPIPNGTKVTMQDAPQLKFVWEDGKIVPALDAKAVAAAREAKFRGGRGSGRLWMFGLGLVLVLIVLVLTWYHRHRSRASI